MCLTKSSTLKTTKAMQFDPKKNPQAEGLVRGINEFRNALVKSNKAFTKEEFLRGLKEIGLPSNCHFWATILNFILPTQKGKLLTKVRKDAYVFTAPKDPICWTDLQALWNSYNKTTKKYSQSYKEKKSRLTNDHSTDDKEQFEELPKELQTPEKKENHEAKDDQLSSQIREAIDLLKSHGFEVLAPVVTLYAKM